MKNLNLAMCVFVLCAMVASRATAVTPRRPNILYFYVDDMGWGSIGPNGQTARKAGNLPYVQTPNLNRLAQEGVNFTRGYGCHVCSPARSSLQTGFHQGHTFADRNDRDNARKAIRADDISIGTALASVGYATGYWGKWGYGGSKDQASPVINNVQTLPTSHGFQHVLAELHHVRAHTFFQPTLWSAPALSSPDGLTLIPNSMAAYAGNSAYPATPALQNHPDYPTTGYCDDAYAFAALDFVRGQGKRYNDSGQPFIGILAVQIPHAPFDEISTLPEWNAAYADDPHYASLAPQTQQWAAMVTRIDAHFGNILAALEDPNSDGDTSDSVADNTLVLFQSDNGGPGGKSNIELDANGGLSGVKGQIQEGGIRVPLVMRWPAMITPQSRLKSGTNCDMIVDVTDMLPTFCELAGAPIPPGIDGVSIAPTLTGRGYQRRRDFIIHEASDGQSIIRGDHKLVRARKSGSKLYDLRRDPAETTDISAQHPKLVTELETSLLGERVDEPKGFANTYHYWTGAGGAQTSDAGNWSDYQYSNAGITYLTDDGPPQLSWIARIENKGAEHRIAVADADLSVLGLEVRGNVKTGARQSLALGPGIDVSGRNEIRLSPLGMATIDGGTMSTLRWVEVFPDAVLQGHGTIDGIVYNNGQVTVDEGGIRLGGDYHQSSDAVIRLAIQYSSRIPLLVDGDARLDGRLEINTTNALRHRTGRQISVLRADRVVGRFDNENDEVVSEDGRCFEISYSHDEVILTLR